MKKLYCSAAMGMILTLSAANALAADNHQEIKFNIASGGVVNIVNSSGSVSLHAGTGQQVSIAYTTHSDKVEVDPSVTADGKRVEVVTHALPQQKPTADESRVDYDLAVPSGVSVIVSTATASITVENLRGDLSLSSDTGQVTVRHVDNSYLHIRSVAAPVTLTDVTRANVEITASGGNVRLVNVSGLKVVVNTISGNIIYLGDCTGGGNYRLTTHSGMIDVTLPETASVDLSAQSVNGSVENEFPLQEKSHTPFIRTPGRSFAGTSHSGSSSVELHSFSGRIRVKKQ